MKGIEGIEYSHRVSDYEGVECSYMSSDYERYRGCKV